MPDPKEGYVCLSFPPPYFLYVIDQVQACSLFVKKSEPTLSALSKDSGYILVQAAPGLPPTALYYAHSDKNPPLIKLNFLPNENISTVTRALFPSIRNNVFPSMCNLSKSQLDIIKLKTGCTAHLFTYPRETTYSKEDIEEILAKPQVQTDIPRTPWRLVEGRKLKNPKAKISKAYGAPLEGCIEKITNEDRQLKDPLKLQEDEIKALYVFGNSVENKEHHQGGFVKFGMAAFTSWWLMLSIPALTLGGSSSNEDIIRKGRKKLDIAFTLSYEQMGDSIAKKGHPFVIFTNYYEMYQHDGAFILRRKDDRESNRLLIQEDFFKDVLLPILLQHLKESNLNKKDLLFFIPFLAHDQFARAFSHKLYNTPVNQRPLNLLSKGVSLCFGEEVPFSLSFWERHQAKISLTVANFLLIAIILIPILTTFGLPAVISALGGIAVFSFIATQAILLPIISAQLVGKRIDKARTCLVDSLEKMKQLHAEFSQDEPTPFIDLPDIVSSESNSHEELFKAGKSETSFEKSAEKTHAAVTTLAPTPQNIPGAQ